MANVIRKQYRETLENESAFRELEKKVILHLGPCAQIEGSLNDFYIYFSDKPIPKPDKANYLFGHVNVSHRLISVKNEANFKKAEKLANAISSEVDWTLEGSYFT